MAIKYNQRGEKARENAGSVNNLVKSALVGAKVDAEIAGLNVRCAEFLELRHAALFSAGGELPEKVIGLLIEIFFVAHFRTARFFSSTKTTIGLRAFASAWS